MVADSGSEGGPSRESRGGSSSVPERIGRYPLQALVVTSNFSHLFRAVDPELNRALAIKLFRVAPSRLERLPYDRAEWQRRFIVEARVLAAIDSPHVIRVDDFGWHEGAPYLVMPYCVANLRREIGRDANDPQQAAALPEAERPRAVAPPRAMEIVRETCLGLAALHAQGFVHRDVKPTNLLLTTRAHGTVKLCDLGLAKLPQRDGSRSVSQAGVWIGTPDYLAPEQRENAAAATDRADVYAAGVLAYRLLTGRLPVGAFPPPGVLVADVPPELDRLVMAMLAPTPRDRPPALSIAVQLGVLARSQDKSG